MIGRSYAMDVLKLDAHGRGAFVLSTALVMVLVTLVMSLGPGMMSRAVGLGRSVAKCTSVRVCECKKKTSFFETKVADVCDAVSVVLCLWWMSVMLCLWCCL